MTVQTYNKTQSLAGVSRPVFRFLPIKLAKILVFYLSIVRPIELVVCQSKENFDGISDGCSYLFWSNGRRWSSDSVRSIFSLVTTKKSLKVSFKNYRHIAISFLRNHVKYAFPLNTDHQAGHSIKSGEWYGKSSNDDEIWEDVIFMNFQVSSGWHKLIDIM